MSYPLGPAFSRETLDAMSPPSVSKDLLPWLLKDRREAVHASDLIIRYPIALPQVVLPPHGLQIAPMEASALLRRVFHVEGGTRDDMVDMPALGSIVGPRHPGLPEGFEVSAEVVERAAKHNESGSSSFLSSKDIVHTRPQSLCDAIIGVLFTTLAFVRALLGKSCRCASAQSIALVLLLAPFGILMVTAFLGGSGIWMVVNEPLLGTYFFSVGKVPLASFGFLTGLTQPSQWQRLISVYPVELVARFVRVAHITVPDGFVARRGARHTRGYTPRRASFSSVTVWSSTIHRAAVQFWEGKLYLLDKVIAATQALP